MLSEQPSRIASQKIIPTELTLDHGLHREQPGPTVRLFELTSQHRAVVTQYLRSCIPGVTLFTLSIHRLLFGDFCDQALHGYNFVSDKEHVLDVELLPGCAGCHDLQVTRTQAEQPMPK